MVQDEIKIAIIMPLFQPNFVIRKALDKIKNQTKIDNIVLYLINDCSPNTDCEYQDLVQEYSQFINIKYFKTEKNSGPGVARNIALNNLVEPYFIFNDDDDQLYDEYTIEKCLNIIQENKDNKIAAVLFSFIIELNDNSTIYKPLTNHTNWCNQTILFNKEFINECNLRMDEKISYDNEDIFFTELIPVYANVKKYLILYKEDIFIKIINHNNDYRSLTYVDPSNKEVLKQILQKSYVYDLIERAEYIKIYKDIVSKYRKLSSEESDIIFNIIFNFYKYCNSILSLLEEYDSFPFTKEETENFQQSIYFFLDLIEKNSAKIEDASNTMHQVWDKGIGENYSYLTFHLFKETFEKRLNKLFLKNNE